MKSPSFASFLTIGKYLEKETLIILYLLITNVLVNMQVLELFLLSQAQI